MTVTLIAVLEKRHLALISLMMAIADEGERATKMVPVKIETAIILLCDKLDRKGITGANNNMANTATPKVITN